MASVGMVGVGDMGSEMVPHLIAEGHQIWAFDTDPERLRAAVTHGARAAESPSDAARHAEVTLSMVMSEDIPVAHFGADGILAGLRPDAVLVICSTTTPAMLDEVRTRAGSGAHVVDAPIVGGVRYAREKSVTFLV